MSTWIWQKTVSRCSLIFMLAQQIQVSCIHIFLIFVHQSFYDEVARLLCFINSWFGKSILQHNWYYNQKCCVLCIANVYSNVLLLCIFFIPLHCNCGILFLLWFTLLKNLSIHSSSVCGPIRDLSTSWNSLKQTPRSPSSRLLLALLLVGLLGCFPVPVPVKAFLRSSRCSGLSLSAGWTPPAWSLRSVSGKLS